MANDTKTEQPRPRAEDTIWVICTSPVTLLMPTAERKLQAGTKEKTAGLEPLKLERGVNVLAGFVLVGESTDPKLQTIDGLPAKVQQLPPAERVGAVRKAFDAARERYPAMFVATGAIPAVISAVGTMAELVSKHLDVLITAATNGTHRNSLEAFSAHPTVPPHIRELARTRLNAWRPAA